MSNAPTTLFLNVPLVRAVYRSGTADTATTVTPDDSGTLFVSLSTTAHTLTLPAVADAKGKAFKFQQAAGTADHVVTCVGTITSMIASGDGSVNKITSTVIGASCEIICDGTNYYVLATTGAWATG